jgi:hypothetical protein
MVVSAPMDAEREAIMREHRGWRRGSLVLVGLSLAGCQGETVPASRESALKTVAGECSGDRFPARIGSPASCCQDGHRTWHTNNNKALIHRVYGEPCREADGVGTNCGDDCVYGPCGGRTEWAVNADEVFIFHPESLPDKCGWDIQGIGTCRVGDTCDWFVKGTRFYPEPYSDQERYPGPTATCPYNRCLPGGIPAP